jgi:DNA-binding SARP family transcriptional activator
MDPKFGVLGPVQVRDTAGRLVLVGGPKPRALTCALVAEAGRVVSTDRLIDQVWGTDPPSAAVGTLHSYVSQLRKVLDPARRGSTTDHVICTSGSGYLLRVAPTEVDASLFALLVEQAEQAEAAEALDTLDRALGLWRGEPYADLGATLTQSELTQPLVELRLRASELRIGALLELGRSAPAATAAHALVREQPLREPYWRQLMLATYRDGRQADALAAYQECRRVLDRELGMAPDTDTENLHTAILRRDPTLRPPVPEVVTVRAAEVTDPRGEALIGREPQLARVGELLTGMHGGSGHLVILDGEAGVGKTRLAEAARDLAEAGGARTVWAATLRDMAAPPLWPWEQVLRALGLPPPDAGNPCDDPATARFRLCERIAESVLEASRERPLFIVLDDLQWADTLSLHVLRLIAKRLDRCGCLVLTTRCTPDTTVDPAVEATVTALDREHIVRRIAIPPLTVDQVATMLASHAAPAGADPVAIHHRTGGNLFYLVELLRCYDGQPHVGEQVPSSVQAVVEQRHDRLPADTRAILRLAALAGADLDLRVLARARCIGASALVAALEPAQGSGLLREDEQTLRWQFAHDIARQALVARIGPSERAQAHALLAEAIVQVHGPDSAEHMDDLAQHRFHGAHGTASESAFLACSAAADQARARLAPDRAARHRERALAVLPTGHQGRRYHTLRALSEEHAMAGNIGGSIRTAAAALAAARATHGDVHEDVVEAAALFGQVALWTWELPAPVEATVVGALRRLLDEPLPPARRSTLLGALAIRLASTGRDRAGIERLAREGIHLARDLDDAALLGRALNNYVQASWSPDREQARLAATEEALALVGRGLPASTEVFARMHRMTILLQRGRLAECERELASSGELARSAGITGADTHATCHRITHAMLRGELAGAARLIDAGYSQVEHAGFQHVEWCRVIQGSGLARATGRLGERAAELVGLAERAWGSAPVRPTAVLATIEAGDAATARQLLSRWHLNRPTGTPHWAGDFMLAELGEVAARLGAPDPAHLYGQLLHQRGRLAVLGTMMLCTGPVDLTLARLAHRLGRSRSASEHLAAAEWQYGHLPGFAHAFDSVRGLLATADRQPVAGS